MGEGELRSVAGNALVKNDVEVERARTVTDGAHASGLGLDCVKLRKEPKGWKLGFDENGGIQEREVGELRGNAHWSRLTPLGRTKKLCLRKR